ncbi:uncharacterized protein J3D65DRAFT_550110 [Phyllosticta citribraziliensis]|uniref:Uncharacterized protein n=1 Tax=Phyllosticta citribraziliensis TaxID=989973 RepID=A0ABR1LXQ1_9PEZI
MFELPNAKRVRRDELHSPASSTRSSPDPDLTNLFRAKLQSRIELVEAQPQGVIQPAQGAHDAGSEDEELEFRLFAAPARGGDGPAPQKIRLKSPDLENAEGGFVNPKRPDSYYFAGVPSDELQRQHESVAVTGDQVTRWAQQKWPGCALPWKVTSISLDKKARETLGLSDNVSTSPVTAKRTRKGKKARIAVRTKLKENAEAKEAQAKAQAEKELAERAKRAKRNRDKKLKKRQRDKAKKAAAGDQGEGQANGEVSGSDGDDASISSS